MEIEAGMKEEELAAREPLLELMQRGLIESLRIRGQEDKFRMKIKLIKIMEAATITTSTWGTTRPRAKAPNRSSSS